MGTWLLLVTKDQLRKQVLLQAEDRAHALQNHLELLSRELRRLGLRSEVDLFDQNLEPERSLLGVSHGSARSSLVTGQSAGGGVVCRRSRIFEVRVTHCTFLVSAAFPRRILSE